MLPGWCTSVRLFGLDCALPSSAMWASTQHRKSPQHSATCGAWRLFVSAKALSCHRGLGTRSGKKLSHLRVLKIIDCFADNSTEAWQAFAAGHSSLREFSFPSSVTDDMVVALATHCPPLSYMVLQSAQWLTDASLLAPAKECPELSQLTLRQATTLSDGSLQALREHHKQYLHLQLPAETRRRMNIL
jgi:hypothetical protein